MKNSKLLAVLLSALLVSLSGCSDSAEKVHPYKLVKPSVGENSGLSIYKVDGVDIECLHKFKSMSCNWEKYNELKKAN